MSKDKKKKKLKIPKSVLDLRMSPKKFAKKNGIKLKGKGMSKSEKKRNRKKLRNAYSESALNGLNKAVKILSENEGSDSKKIVKTKEGVENIITQQSVMNRVAKLYKKTPDNYENMMYLPNMIMNTIAYYSQDSISEEEKELAQGLDPKNLVEFCEKILKSKIKRYRKLGISDDMAYELATVIPTTKVLKNNRRYYQKLIQSLYIIAEREEVNLSTVLPAIQKIDKKRFVEKRDFYDAFFLEFILTRSSNKNLSFNDTQKELHESLIEQSLQYLDGAKGRKCKEILKSYIKRRKTAESYKTDTKRVIKFVDHANSNSSYTNLKSVVQELIGDNSSNELYLS